jgi:hypothetical protein
MGGYNPWNGSSLLNVNALGANLLNEIVKSMPMITLEQLEENLLLVGYDGFSVILTRETIEYAFERFIQRFAAYKGDGDGELMSFIGRLMSRFPGDVIV